ncbi:hypothetical protein HBH56_165280 [Parastagonospora nodorum]|uniref:Uncharacterized protein n=1 Tax=Phaeosphaeria nodorum (strain SN15 / ATCC MYA-4574 / FGSC 10173) TaxID=321614 RepID=A0A7U2F8R6_PHANO|nr:hypothetical protein HBH56_165280 [Parastagonospora nodorum]QRC98479.1 hypothetical protein JI435_045380 [Parastagonospora nodorum SN15]KAH3936184.1 hypothetical protein HBH54_028370 [Parastagonospora nodorum]KAH3948312.1 hypothetical protein HBH53_103170 [Parastagonospora nodorum]KAH4020048.1 hypothetical protein HBI13_121560 [Parastagonospora nodorum]
MLCRNRCIVTSGPQARSIDPRKDIIAHVPLFFLRSDDGSSHAFRMIIREEDRIRQRCFRSKSSTRRTCQEKPTLVVSSTGQLFLCSFHCRKPVGPGTFGVGGSPLPLSCRGKHGNRQTEARR